MDGSPLPFTLRQAQYALAVAQTRNFRQAAEVCAVAQPSLSAQLSALEDALGARLFERGRGGVVPTPAGTALLARMERLVLEARELGREASAFRDPMRGTIRLGVIPTIAPYLLPSLVPALRRALPHLVPLWVEERTSLLVKALAEGALDGAILALEADLGGLETRSLAKDPFAVCLPRAHPLARLRRPLRMDELAGERLLLLEDGHCLRDQALAACAGSRVEELGYRATSLPTLVQMVSSGAGITLLPRLAASEADRAEVALRPLGGTVPSRTLSLIWRRGTAAAPVLDRIGDIAAETLGGM